MHFCLQIEKFLIKIQHIALHFYFGLKNEHWFGPAGSENACGLEKHKWRVACNSALYA